MNRIVIAGGGFAGTCTAIRLLALAERDLEIVLVERDHDRLHGGLAFSSSTAYWEHLLNLQAGRISLYREDRDDFVRWIRHEANKTGWPIEVAKKIFDRSSAVPRCLYQRYLIDRLERAVSGRSESVSFRTLDGEVVDARESTRDGLPERIVVVEGGDGQLSELTCDQLILCTGNLQTRLPACISSATASSETYFEDQYSPKARAAFKNLKEGQKVLVLGSALRACDVVMTLRSDLSELKKNVKVSLISRYGRRHKSYPAGHLHEVIHLEKPEFLNTEGKLSKEEFVQGVAAAFKKASDQNEHISENIRDERILKAWEQYVPGAVKKLSNPAFIKELLQEYKSLITIKRIGVVPEIGDVLDESIKDGSCEVRAATIQSVEVTSDGRFEVKIQGQNELEYYDMVVNCVGREQDYRKIKSRLWINLFESEKVRIHELTEIGVDVDEEGLFIGANGQSSSWISGVGVMREGVEFERHGRLGSFSFTLGPLKNEAFEVAFYTLRRLENEQKEDFARLPKLDGSDLNPLLENCFQEAWRKVNSEITPAEKKIAEILEQRAWLLIVKSMTCRSYVEKRDRGLLESQVKLEERLHKLVARSGASQNEEARDIVAHFLGGIKEMSLTHLTRLDEVEPVLIGA